MRTSRRSAALTSRTEAIFLIMILAYAAALIYTIRRISIPELGRVHQTLRVLGLITPLLIIRGAWGIVQAVDLSQSFASPDSYGASALPCAADLKSLPGSAASSWLRSTHLLRSYATALTSEPNERRWNGYRRVCCS